MPNINTKKYFWSVKILSLWIGRSDRIRSSLQNVQVDRNAESDPILEKDLDLERDPKKSTNIGKSYFFERLRYLREIFPLSLVPFLLVLSRLA